MRDEPNRVSILHAGILAGDLFVHGNHQPLFPHELEDILKLTALSSDDLSDGGGLRELAREIVIAVGGLKLPHERNRNHSWLATVLGADLLDSSEQALLESLSMQSLDVERPGLPDLQFVLLVVALCTSELPDLNIPPALRRTIFDRCWALIHDTPPPSRAEDRVLDLRQGTDLTLDAMIEVIRRLLVDAGIATIRWDHPPSEPTRTSSPEALPLIERLQQLYPPSDPAKSD
jgi:hypothetical protein